MTIRVLQQVQEERPVRGGRRLTVACRDEIGVPAILLVPPHGSASVSAALLLHGHSSGKDGMADTIGRVLLTHGVASLAIDLPLRGELPGDGGEPAPPTVIDLLCHWSTSIANATLGLRCLAGRPEVDPRRIGIVGYSVGCFVALAMAAADPTVSALVLAAAGDLPISTASESLVRCIVDPVTWLRSLAGRPLLMMNGRRDAAVATDQAERLYAAAADPKEQRWYDGGAWLPPQAVQYGGEWLAARLGEGRGPG